MNIDRITTIAFSPCGGTAERVQRLANTLSDLLSLPVSHHCYTLPADRKPLPRFASNELLLWASPVYAGRLPNKLIDYVSANLHGDGTPFVGLVTFGNRSVGDALAELVGIARRGGCRPIAATALVMPHVFSSHIAAQRPTVADNLALDTFAHRIAEKVQHAATELPPFDNEEPTEFYTPLRTDGQPARFLKAMPEVDASRCTHCGICATLCPMGSISTHSQNISSTYNIPDIDATEMPHFHGICIKCQACIKHCPQKALRMTDADFLSHTAMLEANFTQPAQNLYYV